jgi:hypothetical protein
MKASAIQKLRSKLARDECVYGLWVTLESASITEMAVAAGLDWVVIDAEHGHLDWGDLVEHLRATALQPRGRVHYFINESAAPMAMIWFYAGPMPERLVVDEACATTAGDPWR